MSVALPAMEAAAQMPEKHRVVLENHCFHCHDSEIQEGKVNLEALSFDISSSIATAEIWQKVLNAINSGDMPPEDESEISQEDKVNFLRDLSIQLAAARKRLSDSGGKNTIRRLNRREYQNTIETLLGIRPDVSSLPDDVQSGGYDTNGTGLFFSADQFQQYLKTARATLQQVVVGPKRPKSSKQRIQPEEEWNKDFRRILDKFKSARARAAERKKNPDKPASDFGFTDDKKIKSQLRFDKIHTPAYRTYFKQPQTKDGVILFTGPKGALPVKNLQLPTKGGRFRFRMRVATAADSPKYFEYGLRAKSLKKGDEGEIETLGYQRVAAPISQPKIVQFEVDIPNGESERFRIRNRVVNSRNSQIRVLYRPLLEKNSTGFDPGVWIDWIEWEGPLVDEWPPQATKELLFRRPKSMSDQEYATSVIERFAVRAFRNQKPQPEFLEKLYRLYAASREQGVGFREAIVDPLAIILSSPRFLYLSEPGESNQALGHEELAVRLAYFLWSTPPDNTLDTARLLDPKSLIEQTDRLLADDRVKEFITGFTHQWLDMERLDFFQFPASLYPEFDDTLRASAREEIYQTVRTLIREDLPLDRLLKSDFVVINDVLGDYYEIKGVEGAEFRKVKLTAKSPRGGLLGTAAVSAMGSDGTRSSPVERGAWVLRHLLNDPPPPAPPNVPQLSRLEGEMMPARKLLSAHMEEAQCAHCHRKIDPIGFGLENFDAAGKWRSRELVTVMENNRVEQSKAFPIKLTGTLPDGTAFTNYFELRDAIANQKEAFARGFSEALIAYAMGRSFSFTDQDLRDRMVQQAEANQYRVSSFFHTLVQSETFRSK